MKLFSLTSIPTKAAAAGVLGLAALGGTGTALVLQPAADTRSPAAAEVEKTTTPVVEDETTKTSDGTAGEDEATTTDTEGLASTGEVTTDGDSEDDETAAKDNFGAVVSADARDGGVDGQEISAAAHARNEARKAQHPTPPVDDETDDESDDDTDDESDDDADDADDADDESDDDAPEARTHGRSEDHKG